MQFGKFGFKEHRKQNIRSLGIKVSHVVQNCILFELLVKSVASPSASSVCNDKNLSGYRDLTHIKYETKK